MSFSEILKEIPALVKTEFQVAELRKQLETLCNGSEFEKASVEHHFEKAIRDKFGVIGPQRKFILAQNTEYFKDLGTKEFQTKIPSLTISKAQNMASERDAQIKATVEAYIQRSLDLCDKFGSEVERLATQAFNHKLAEWDKTTDSRIEGMIEQKLLKMPEGLHKAIIHTSLAERPIHFSDLNSPIFKRVAKYLEKNNGHERGDS